MGIDKYLYVIGGHYARDTYALVREEIRAFLKKA
jgi:hypothetical protein